jgi:hypothetical protein
VGSTSPKQADRYTGHFGHLSLGDDAGVGVQNTVLSIPATPASAGHELGADIYVDQNFVGNTPSTVNAPSGKHSITVRKPGFQDWVREMNLSGGTITLAAELVPGSTVPSAAPQGQAQSVQLQNADVTATSEVSVAEAARRDKAVKEAEKPKDNPPPQQ